MTHVLSSIWAVHSCFQVQDAKLLKFLNWLTQTWIQQTKIITISTMLSLAAVLIEICLNSIPDLKLDKRLLLKTRGKMLSDSCILSKKRKEDSDAVKRTGVVIFIQFHQLVSMMFASMRFWQRYFLFCDKRVSICYGYNSPINNNGLPLP